MDEARSLPVERLWCWDGFRLEERDCIHLTVYEKPEQPDYLQIHVYLAIDREEWNGSKPSPRAYQLGFHCWRTIDEGWDAITRRWKAEAEELTKRVERIDQMRKGDAP